MNNIPICFKCKLSLPYSYGSYAIVQQGQQKQKVFLCDNCRKELEKQFKGAK